MRIIFVLAILIIDLFANSSEIETKIYEKIISNFDKNSEIKVYSNDKNILNEIKKYSKKLVVSNKKDSKVYILSTNIGNIPDDKLVIVTNYELLKEIKNSLAAFYWKKGRPNILFIKDRIKKRNLFLNKEYDKYSEVERCLYELCF
jgi:sugar-specific transcriptional regulator TrmB